MRIMAALLALAMLAPVASAQQGLSIAVDQEPADLDPNAGGRVGYTLQVGCADIVESGPPDATIAVGAMAPTWLSVGGDLQQTVSLAECIGQTEVSRQGNLSLTPSLDAPGLTPTELAVNASMALADGTTSTAEDTTTVQVGYRPGYSVTPGVQFPLQVTEEGQLTFNLSLTLSANADSMVMLNVVQEGEGTLAGLAPASMSPGETKRMEVTWTPPEGDWDESVFVVQTLHHCAGGSGCTPMDQREQTWTFLNAIPADPDKDSPGVGWLLGVAVLAVAALMRRRL